LWHDGGREGGKKQKPRVSEYNVVAALKYPSWKKKKLIPIIPLVLLFPLFNYTSA